VRRSGRPCEGQRSRLTRTTTSLNEPRPLRLGGCLLTCSATYRQSSRPREQCSWNRRTPQPSSGQLETVLAIRFDRDMVAVLRKVARAKGIGATALLRLWTIERLEAELARARKIMAWRTA
jgi:hypothetical protein